MTDKTTSALKRYKLPRIVEVKLYNVSENETYKVTDAEGGCYALRLHRIGYHARAAIESELQWMMALRDSETAITPLPIIGRDGEMVQQIGKQHAVLTHWEGGETPEITGDLVPHFKSLGQISAGLHKHARSWERPPSFSRFTWDFETTLGEHNPHWGFWRNGIGIDARLEQIFRRTVDVIGARLAHYGKSSDRFGLIHADIRLANLLIDGGDIKLLDFDDSGFGWFMYDAATTVSFHEHEPKVPELIAAWKDGFRSVAPLSKQDEAIIPTFLMLRRLLLVAWLGTHRQIDLAKELGANYTVQSADLCETYLAKL